MGKRQKKFLTTREELMIALAEASLKDEVEAETETKACGGLGRRRLECIIRQTDVLARVAPFAFVSERTDFEECEFCRNRG